MLCPNRTTLLIGHILGLAVCTSVLISCGGSDSSSSSTPPAAVGTTVQVSVAATDPNGDQLHYRWAATEGTISNVDAPNTTWVVPHGSGLQFAYVVVSDNKGGYTERRAAALTFDPPAVTPAANISHAAPVGSSGFAWGSVFYKPSAFGRNVYLPGVTVTLSNNRSAITDMKGQFFISNLPDRTYSATFQIPGRPAVPFSNSIVVNSAALATSPSSGNYFLGEVSLSDSLNVAGSVRLADESYCGIRDEFFTHSSDPNLFTGPVSGTAQLLDTADNPLSSTFPVNHYGDFLIVRSAVTPGTQAKVRISCDQALVTTTVSLPNASGPVKLPTQNATVHLTNKRPIIHTMAVLLNGQDVGRPDLPKATTLLPEMDLVPGDDAFLTYKGLDTRKGACAYYHKIGAVQGCDVNGFPTGAQLTLDQWKKKFNLSPSHNGNPAEPEFKAIFINKQDLNLTRDMQGIKLQNGTLAYNVCNYPGPQDVNDSLGTPKQIGEETQADINLAIENARRGIGIVVCVAMDYSVTPGLNGDQPFTKFYTFGPTGKLLLSVSLDGRREKFMPGSCVACHGGDNYGGKFPDDYSQAPPTGSGPANLGSYFLPFDVANLYFSTSDPSLSRTTLLIHLRRMNELLASVPVNLATKPIPDDLKTLITTRWYPPTNTDNEQTHPAPSAYSNQQIAGTGVPTGGSQCTSCHTTGGAQGPYDATAIFTTAIAPSCQVCHTSNSIIDDPQAGGSPPPRITFFERPPAHYLSGRGSHPVCGKSPDLEKNHVMPNALGSFERFWLKKGTNQPASLFSLPPPKTGQQSGACATPSPHPGL